MQFIVRIIDMIGYAKIHHRAICSIYYAWLSHCVLCASSFVVSREIGQDLVPCGERMSE